jgi:hypothetical protein
MVATKVVQANKISRLQFLLRWELRPQCIQALNDTIKQKIAPFRSIPAGRGNFDFFSINRWHP